MTATLPRLARTTLMCGACAAGLHQLCPIAVWNPGAPVLDDKGKPTDRTGVATRCPCEHPSHEGAVPRCRDCGQRGQDDLTEQLRCSDPMACELRIEARLADDPLHQLLAECRTTRLEGGEVVERKRRPTQQEVAKRRAEKAAKVARPCECGCEGTTKGGAFLPGHDARLLAQLAEQVRQTPLTRGAERQVREQVAQRLAPFPALQAKFNKRMGWGA